MADHRPFRLPNGLTVYSLNANDTLMVYRDLFEDDCYRRHGVSIREGDCILDVGANTGLFILYLNEIIESGIVYAFEPVPATFRVLARNVALHDRLSTQLFNMGLSHRSGAAKFTHYPRMSNASTMYPDNSSRAVRRDKDYILEQFDALPRPLAALLAMTPSRLREALAGIVRKYYLKRQEVTCQLTTLSEFLSKHAIRRIDLLKLDAEQSERQILDGLAEHDWHKVRQMVVEVHEGEEATEAMAASLRGRGFVTAVEPNPTFPSLSLVFGTRPQLVGTSE